MEGLAEPEGAGAPVAGTRGVEVATEETGVVGTGVEEL